MTSITSHTGASMPSQHPPGAAGFAAGPSHPPPSTYTTQTLPIAVPLPDFWHHQRPSPSANHSHHLERPQSHYQYAISPPHPPPSVPAANPESSHHAWPADERSHQQHETRPSSSSNTRNQPLNAASPHVYYHSQHHQPAYVYAVHAPSTTDITTLPLHQQYPVASSSSSVQAPPSNQDILLSSSTTRQHLGKENIPPASPKASKDLQSEKESENVNQKVNEDRSETPNADTPNEFSEAELTARFSSVSQIEAQPTLDPETGEAVYPCPFCDKHYGGKHARSIWRRHLSNKHGIPLNLQPRRTRWDNGECRKFLVSGSELREVILKLCFFRCKSTER